MKNLKTKSIQAISWSFLQVLCAGGINFLVGIYLARLLEPRDFGLIGMIMIFISLSQILIDGGLVASLIRTENPDKKDYSRYSLLIYLEAF